MPGMLYKELRLNIVAVLIALGAGVVMMSIFTVLPLLDGDISEEVLSLLLLLPATMIMAMSGTAAGGSFQADERKKWAYFTVSLPSDHRTAIGAKYIFNVFVLLTAKFIIELYICIVSDTVTDCSLLLSITPYIPFFVLFIQSLLFPTVIRFGSTVSSYFRIAVLLAACIAAGVWFLYFKPDGLDLSGVWDIVFRFINGDNAAVKAASLLNILCLAVIPVYYLSYRLSCRFYLKGVETHYAK